LATGSCRAQQTIGEKSRVRMRSVPPDAFQGRKVGIGRITEDTMDQKIILLLEDNPNDEALALRALKKHTIRNAVVMHHGVEALKYLFGTGVYASRDLGAISRVILLDLNPPQRGMER